MQNSKEGPKPGSKHAEYVTKLSMEQAAYGVEFKINSFTRRRYDMTYHAYNCKETTNSISQKY